MIRKFSQRIKASLGRESRQFIFEPVAHRMNSHPVLPQGLMSAIAPAYEEALDREKEEKKFQDVRG